MFRPNRFVVAVQVSFETGEQATIDVYFPGAVTITGLRAHAVKAIAGTDNATITAKNSADSAMSTGVLTFTASDAINTKKSATPTTNNAVAAGDFARFVVAKTTAGGKAILFIEYKLTQ